MGAQVGGCFPFENGSMEERGEEDNKEEKEDALERSLGE